MSADLNPDAHARIVMLTYGRMQDGKSPYWCYIAVKPSEYDRFQAVLKSGRLNLQRFEEDGFGEVVVSGPGLTPPPNVTKEVAKAFKTPIRDLFGDVDPQTLMARKIKEMKSKADNGE